MDWPLLRPSVISQRALLYWSWINRYLLFLISSFIIQKNPGAVRKLTIILVTLNTSLLSELRALRMIESLRVAWCTKVVVAAALERNFGAGAIDYRYSLAPSFFSMYILYLSESLFRLRHVVIRLTLSRSCRLRIPCTHQSGCLWRGFSLMTRQAPFTEVVRESSVRWDLRDLNNI